jgi:hypothetical protein
VPGWHSKTKALQDEGRIQLVGIIQEQHAERCRLFMQWHQMGWPILVDSLNVTGSRAVPRFFGLDECGVVRLKVGQRTDLERDLISKSWPETAAAQVTVPAKGTRAHLVHQGDELFHWGGADKLDAAIEKYASAVAMDAEHGPTLFRLGVAHRRRYESGHARRKDFQVAVDYWSAALDVDPNQYIWMRRIQQFGPRLSKPYPFYDWVAKAAADISARGEKPVSLRVQLTDSERVGRGKWTQAEDGAAQNPDPKDRISRDKKGLIDMTVVAVPAVGRAGSDMRLHIQLKPRPKAGSRWNNESDPLRIWIHSTEGIGVARQRLLHGNPKQATSQETRHLEVDLRLSWNPTGRALKVRGYALYNVCEDANGQCLLLRQDFEITLPASP